jgi:glycosyltransferase involved in cell wall biosynthesis
MAEPLVSVVTPFYNTDAYLAECIESVLAQTYRNFEYVLVDNHSTDRSGAIAESFAQRDPRIRFIRADEFRRQIPNYNYALRQASPDSRYLKMAQADDWLYPRCLTEMVELAEANHSVGVVSSYELRENEVHGTGLRARETVLPGREAARRYFLQWIFPFGSPTTVLYRHDVVRARTPFFDEERIHCDTDAMFRILAEHDFGFVHQVLSFIRTQEDSITGRMRDLADNSLDRLVIVKHFARTFLDSAELDECVSAAESWYYDDLARTWIAERFGPKREDFWKFHGAGLKTIGETVDWQRVYRAAGALAMERLLNPGQSLRKLRRQGVRPNHAVSKDSR